MKIFSQTGENYDMKRFRMRRTLMKHRSNRTDSEIYEAAEVLQVNPFLSKFVENDALKNLIQLMNLEFFEQGDVLFSEGDIGDKFYIIYDGRVGISIGDKGMVSELKRGDSFGELSLLFGQPRSGTAIVLEKTELITLSKDSYEQIIKVITKQKIHTSLGNDHFNFLRSIPLFSKMSKLSANYLTQISQLRRYSALYPIASQGEKPGHIYLLYSGSIKLFKEIEFRVSNSNDTESRARTPTYKDHSKYEKVFLEEVHQGFIIGAYEFFYNVPMQYSAVCSMPCQVFIFDKYIFEKIDKESLLQFKSSLQPYIPDRAIKRNYFHDIKWNIYKKKLIENIHIQRAIDRKYFLTDRSPVRSSKQIDVKKIKLPQVKVQTSRSTTQPKLRKFLKTPTFIHP